MSKVQWLKGYYLLLGYVTFAFGFKRFSNLIDTPDSWLPGFNLQQLGFLFLFLTVLLSGLCAFRPLNSWFRKSLFVAFFLFEMQFNYVGAPTHLYQFWLWSSLALALMPRLTYLADLDKPQNSTFTNESAKHLDLGIKTCLSIILLMYFFSGFWKSVGIVQQLWAGEPHLLSSQGLLFHMYSEIIRANAKPVLMNFLTQYSFLNPMLGFSVVVVQLSCGIGIVKTQWQRLLGIGLVLFHVGTALILDITYPTNLLLIIWCFILSPVVRPLEYPVADTGVPS